MARTTEGAGEGEAGVMWNPSSSIFHIQRVHGEHVLGKRKTQLEYSSISTAGGLAYQSTDVYVLRNENHSSASCGSDYSSNSA